MVSHGSYIVLLSLTKVYRVKWKKRSSALKSKEVLKVMLSAINKDKYCEDSRPCHWKMPSDTLKV